MHPDVPARHGEGVDHIALNHKKMKIAVVVALVTQLLTELLDVIFYFFIGDDRRITPNLAHGRQTQLDFLLGRNNRAG